MHIVENMEGDPQINSIEYNDDCTLLAVGGANPKIRIYDTKTRKLKHLLDGQGSLMPGHSNRVFCVRFVKGQNIVISSGWDHRMIFWDLETGEPLDSLNELRVFGDGIDISQGVLLTSNFRERKSIQLYDLNTRKEINFLNSGNIEFGIENENTKHNTMAYFGKFDRILGKYILTGGTSPNRVYLLDISNKQYAVFSGFANEIYCGDWNSTNSLIAFSGKEGSIWIYKVALT